VSECSLPIIMIYRTKDLAQPLLFWTGLASCSKPGG
jgi:hypothetical protein